MSEAAVPDRAASEGPSDALVRLLDDRLILVTGKGGTGKTTMAAAVALLLAARGRRTLLCEVDADRPALAPIFGVEPGFEPVRAAPGLEVCNLVWPASLGAYLHRTLRIGRVVRSVLGNDLLRRFLDFVPGSQELVTLSAIVDLRDRYDAVVVDLPASGHAYSMLDITRSALSLFRGGPIRGRAQEIRRVLVDPRTRVVLTALPEDMVVNETLETLGKLRDGGYLGGEPVVLLNRAVSGGPDADEAALLDLLSAAPLSPGAEALVAAGRWERRLAEATVESRARLAEGAGAPPVLLPPVSGAGDARSVVRGVAAHLAGLLGVREPAWT